MLEDDAPLRPGSGHWCTTDRDVASGGCHETGDELEQGGLPAAARSDHRDELPGGDVEVDVGEGGDRATAAHRVAMRDAGDTERPAGWRGRTPAVDHEGQGHPATAAANAGLTASV